MRYLLLCSTVLLTPDVVLACGRAAAGCAGGGCAGKGDWLGALVMAAAAVAGWWVLKHEAKDDPQWTRYAGRAVGWVLIVLGLLGFACAAMSHSKKNMGCGGSGCALKAARGGASYHHRAWKRGGYHGRGRDATAPSDDQDRGDAGPDGDKADD